MSRKDLSLAAIFAAPALLASLSLAGLTVALLDDGAWDWIGAALLGLCLLVPAGVRLARRIGHQGR